MRVSECVCVCMCVCVFWDAGGSRPTCIQFSIGAGFLFDFPFYLFKLLYAVKNKKCYIDQQTFLCPMHAFSRICLTDLHKDHKNDGGKKV